MRLLDVAFAYVREFTQVGPVYKGHYRRVLVPDFPYGVFYSLEGGRIIIVAILDLRQDPGIIRKRLKR